MDPEAQALEAKSEELWWRDEVPESIAFRERAFARARECGDLRDAIRIAGWLAREHISLGNAAISDGWIARAERIAEEIGSCPEMVWIELIRAKRAPDAATCEQHAMRAWEIGRKSGDIDLEMWALSELGRAAVTRGRIDDGMRQLDEAVAAATGGEMHQLQLIGDTCCNMISACERASDYNRLSQWCQTLQDFCERNHCAPIMSYCHMVYGGALIATGKWAEAEKELKSAIRVGERGHPLMRIPAQARLALLRVREGKYDEARAFLAGIEESRAAAQAVASLELALGNAPMAAVVLRRHLRDTGEDDLTAAPMLDILSAAMIALGDREQAQRAADRLSNLAARADRPAVRAFASRAAARIGNDIEEFDRAATLFGEASMPFDAAHSHLELAERAEGNVAEFHARAAMETFERLGARAYADRAAARLRFLGVRGRAMPRSVDELTKREREVFNLIGAGLSNPEIAERLFISAKTVEHHVSRILAKTGCRNRVEAATLARE